MAKKLNDGDAPVAPADVAKRLAQSWRGGVERLADKGIGAREIGASLLGVALEQLLAAEPSELVAAQLRALAEQIEAGEKAATEH